MHPTGVPVCCMLWPVRELMSEGALLEFYDLMTAPASKLLDKWMESDPLKATLATDSVIGAATTPYAEGSGYVTHCTSTSRALKPLSANARFHTNFRIIPRFHTMGVE